MATPAPFTIPSGPDCVELHRGEARALPSSQVRDAFDVPLRVIVDEGHDTGEYARRYWSPADPSVPGLERVAFRVPAETPSRLASLAAAAREMCYVVTVGRGNASLRATFEEGERVLQRLRDDLGFWLDDGIDTPEDEDFAALGAEHDDTLSIDRLAAALYDYGRLGQQLGPDMTAAGMTTWDPATVERAFALHETLKTPVPAPDRADIDLRNRLLVLLQKETGRVRRAAAYLWAREHRDVYGLFTSGWLRNKKLAAKRRAAAAEQATADASPT